MTNESLIALYASLVVIALVDALSPVRVAVILVLLTGTRPVWRGAAFIMGIAVFNLIFGISLVRFFEVLPTVDVELGSLGLIVGFLLGVGLLIFAVRTWRTKPVAADSGQSTPLKLPAFVSRFTDRVLNGSVGVVFAGGILMQLLSFKSLILLSAALKRILEAKLPPSGALIALIFFIVVDLIEMIVPTVIFAASPDNSARRLSQMSQWLLHYSYPILAVAEGAVAVYLIAESIAGFLS